MTNDPAENSVLTLASEPSKTDQPGSLGLATGSPIDRLLMRWDGYIADTDRVIQNPEACHRAGVLEINRLRTVNSVRREMLTELRSALLANK